MTFKNDFCSYCGHRFNGYVYPKTCNMCDNITYINPLPVVVLLPVIDLGDNYGVLLVKRGHEPKKGLWSLPGGYMEVGEEVNEALAREVREETSLIIEPSRIKIKEIKLSTDKVHLVISGKVILSLDKVNEEIKIDNNEVVGYKIITEPEDLAFDLHTELSNKFLREDRIELLRADYGVFG